MKIYPSQRHCGFAWRLLVGSLFAVITCTTASVPGPSLVFDHNSQNNAPYSLQLQEVLTEEAIADIASEVATRISLPFSCPEPVITFATTKAMEAIASKLSPELVRQIGDVVTLDDVDQLDQVAKIMATELNAQLNFPFLDEEQEQIVFQISISFLRVLSSSKSTTGVEELVDQSVEKAQSLLSPLGRQKLAQKLNAKADFPFLNEAAENELIVKALDACADRLQQVLPPELVTILKGQGPRGLKKTKKFLVKRLNHRVNIFGLSEEQEAWLMEQVISLVLDTLLGDTEAELRLMSTEERQEKLLERRAILQREMDLSRRRFEREHTDYQAQLEEINGRLKPIRTNGRRSAFHVK
jgi:hypothetical protein